MQQLASGDAPSHPPRGTKAGVAGKTAPLCVRAFDVQPGSCQDYLYDRSSHANPLEPNTGLLSHSCLISTLAYLKKPRTVCSHMFVVFEYLPWDRSKE